MQWPSARLIAAYALDWVIIIALAAAGGGLNFVTPKHRAFSLLDLTISYPEVPESISVSTLLLTSLVAPGIIIAAVALLAVPGRSTSRAFTRAELIRRKLWELHNGLAGLALSVALGFFITQGLKELYGRPRPHFLSICNPDLDNITQHVVGGYGSDISPRWTLVNPSICRNVAALTSGFRSFPSGHCSWSWSGMLYLALFLCAKFGISFPRLPLVTNAQVEDTSTDPALSGLADRGATAKSSSTEILPLDPLTVNKMKSSELLAQTTDNSEGLPMLPVYNQAAAPPVWGILLIIIPLGVATYISSTRYAEYWHHGFDVIAGSLVGIVSAYVAFRWYQMPLQQGQGWAWGPRSRERAFGTGVGMGSRESRKGPDWQGT